MRAIFVVALMALGLAFTGTSPASAAPLNGSAIGHAAGRNQVVDQVHWRRHHHHRHCWVGRYGRLHCSWW
jgi:hypothetical protein